MEAVAGALGALLDAGLITPADEGGRRAFAFRHALLQDAAYASLLRAERRSLHRLVGETLEQVEAPASAVADRAPRLAEHFRQAGDLGRSLGYFLQAGEAAARRYANAEAIAHFRQARSLLDRRQTDPAQWQQVLLGLGQAFELSGQHADALAAYQDLEDFAGAQEAPAVEQAAALARAKLYSTLTPVHDARRARHILEQTLAEARGRRDGRAEARVLWNLMVLEMWSGEDYAASIEFGTAAVELARRSGDDERLAFALNDLAYPYLAIEHYGAARDAVRQAEPLWRQQGNVPMLVDNLAQAVLLDFHFGDFEAADRAASEAIRRSDEIGNVWGQTNSRLCYGHVLWAQGRIGAALDTMRTAIRLGESSRHPGALVGTRTDLALLLADLGAGERG
ncbi:MAG TPA: hypothetical protein VK449_03830, partial [Anaerolineales bacterium]|nr:hypothetical protein [Anaerolineales bacterium]